jgi:Uma2 family endonuclease
MSVETLSLPKGTNGQISDDSLYEVINGQRVEIPHMGAFAGTVASMIVHYLNEFALPKKLGFAVNEVLFNLGVNRQQRRPDLAFISWDRWKVPPIAGEDPPAWDVVPNIMGEAVSPTNTAEEIEVKMLEYFAAGVMLVWVIYPRQERIYVYESPTKVHILQMGDELDGGAVLPGFRVKLADLFGAIVKP